MRDRYGLQRLIVIFCISFIPCGCGQSPASPPPKESAAEHKAEEHRPMTVHLSQSTQQELEITVLPTEIGLLEQTLELTGQIAQDTDRLTHVHSPEAGSLNKILVKPGDRITANAPVAEVISSRNQEPIRIPAPSNGLILGIHMQPGRQVDTLSSLLTIADLSQVWATFDLYEQDAALVQVGQRIEAVSVAYPDRPFSGKVIFVSPQVDPHTRTIKVRAQIENPDYALKLGMFVTGTLYIPTAEKALLIPHAAVQRIEKEQVVFVQTAPEMFEAREVKLGLETRSQAQILEGLKPGEPVVASGSFHLKAELLKGTLEEGHSH